MIGADTNITAILVFLLFVFASLGITWWAARRTRSAGEFYTAGGKITGFQNGLALAGDFMSAATFLGLTGLAFIGGADAMLFTVGVTVSWAFLLFVFADRLRNLGRYTFADIIAYRLRPDYLRIVAAVGTLTVAIPYLIAQMVGAGSLIETLFGLPYFAAVFIVGSLMTIYVVFGGMLATTWVQVIKAVLLLTGGTAMVLLALAQFGFDLNALFCARGRGASAWRRDIQARRPVQRSRQRARNWTGIRVWDGWFAARAHALFHRTRRCPGTQINCLCCCNHWLFSGDHRHHRVCRHCSS